MVQTPLTVLDQAANSAGPDPGASSSSPKILVMYFDAAGGHRNAANALLEVGRQQQRSWDLKLVNLQELLDELDIIRKVSGLRVQEVYNQMLSRGWTLGSAQALKVLHLLIRWRAPKLT